MDRTNFNGAPWAERLQRRGVFLMRDNAESTIRDALADFLRRRREALSPQAADVRTGRRRRTPGLRRDEVASLANMSTAYYERLEQGRGPRPSTAILAGLARALRLDLEERSYLYQLAGLAEPVMAKTDGAVDPRLLSVMWAVDATCPAFVTDDLTTVMAQNELHIALFGSLTDLPDRQANLFWYWFGSGQSGRSSVPDSPEQHEAIGSTYVAFLRRIVADRGYDDAALALVSQLRESSAEFVRMWDEHRVSASSAVVSVQHDRIGRLDFDCMSMVSEPSRQRLFTLHAVPDTLTQQRLEWLRDHAAF